MDRNIITYEDCELILVRHFGHKNIELLDYTIQYISGDVEGYSGEYFHLTIKYKNHNEPSSTIIFFLKTQPFQNELQLEYSKQIEAFEKEIFFYEKLMSEFKKYHKYLDDSFIPKYYLSKENNAIVLEDCTQNGFKTVTKAELDVRHFELVLELLAKLHAASIIFEEKKSKELHRTYRLVEDYKKYFQEEAKEDENNIAYQTELACQNGILAIIDSMPERSDLCREEFKQKFVQLDHSFKVVNATQKHRNVCCHGDMWQNNIMFKYKNSGLIPVHCKLVDFQQIKYFPPIFDVLRLIYISTSLKWRQDHLSKLINYYYECLCREIKLGDVNPEEVLTYEQLMNSIEELLPFVKIHMAYCRVYGLLDNIMLNDKEITAELLFKDTSEIVRQYNDPDLAVKFDLDEIMTEIGDIIVDMC